MERVSLAAFVAEHKQVPAAALLGMSQPGVSKALRSGRAIWVEQGADGAFRAVEERVLGREAAGRGGAAEGA